jgi:uncharacterized protein YajQ (UPF0234 family)
MAQFSFDIECDYDVSELNNVLDQTKREIANRYDFKNTACNIDWQDTAKSIIVITGDNEFHIDSIIDILRKKLALRGQSQKIIDVSGEVTTSNLKSTKKIPLVKGLDQAKSKQITSLLKEQAPKVKTQIQGDVVRVSSPKKDDLQLAINSLKSHEFDFPLIFTNYR